MEELEMFTLSGKSVYKGIAMGPVVVLKKDDCQVQHTKSENPEGEIQRVNDAIEQSKEQLQHLYEKASATESPPSRI